VIVVASVVEDAGVVEDAMASRFKQYNGLGWVLYHSDGIISYPDSVLDIEYRVNVGDVIAEGDTLYHLILASYEDHEDLEVLAGVKSIRRFEGIFLTFNLGSCWTGWGYGDTKEEALEMLDDQYGIFDDLF